MATKQAFLTVEGQQKLLKELDYLREVRRKEVAERIRNANELLDTYDSPEYIDAKNEQGFVEGRILTIERILREAVIIREDAVHHEVVQIGSRVTILDEDGEQEEFTIVGSAEANARMRKISNESPVGCALLGRRAGDQLTIPVPSGVRNLTVVAVA
ncbi:MAG: transcription elongation factor GreA [Chloroflexi bacterium]|nr:transcription elongation factor GreA [Chloroflexota bacterium]